MRTLRCACLVAMAVLLSAACGDKAVNPFESFRYPLEVGNRWVFSITHEKFNFRPDIPGATPPDTTPEFEEVVVGVSAVDTLYNGLAASRVYEFTRDPNSTNPEAEGFFVNADDGLYDYGSTRPQRAVPSTALAKVNRLMRPVSALIEGSADSRYPRKSLQYPMRVGEQWVVIEHREDNWIWTDKRIIGEETVRVPAGVFRCLVVQRLIDANADSTWDESIEWHDYIGDVGLVKRTILSRDVTATTYMYPNGVGLIDLLTSMELASVHIE